MPWFFAFCEMIKLKHTTALELKLTISINRILGKKYKVKLLGHI